MNVFDMVVVIVVIGCLTGVIKEFLKTRQKTARSVINEDLDDALDKIDGLEERVRVLEKVVTDDRYDLGREIDKLKD